MDCRHEKWIPAMIRHGKFKAHSSKRSGSPTQNGAVCVACGLNAVPARGEGQQALAERMTEAHK